ncbi:4'-phosphopantetheinyl transferase [cyanobacterium TDX16]|nr:4'-phosphopantetheinyl transferase [cyanobacterium TDX16]
MILRSESLVLSQNEIHVWRASLGSNLTYLQQLVKTLSVDELDRANRFHFEADRNRFIIGRGILRSILSYYLDIAPHQLQFCYGSHGKPALKTCNLLHFNLSHSQDLALYAFTRDRQIGIDLEYVRHIPELDRIVAQFFSARERGTFLALPSSQQVAAFFHGWTCKEAILKALGDGLALPLNQFDVSLLPDRPAQLLSINGDRAAAERWLLQSFIPASDYVAAMAVEGHDWKVKCWQWQGLQVKNRDVILPLCEDASFDWHCQVYGTNIKPVNRP